MSMLETIIAVLAGAIGVAVGVLVESRRSASTRVRADVAEARITDLQQQALRESAAWQERLAAARADDQRLRDQFEALSAQVLKDSQASLLTVAQERLARDRQSADAALAAREQAVRHLVEPVAAALEKVQNRTEQADKDRAATHAALSEQLSQVMTASQRLEKRTSEFITTLRRSDVRGNWGEVQLRRVVELSGMVEHVDFAQQESVRDGEGRLNRPDLTVRLAGGRTIVVDSKVALSGLIEAFEADDEPTREDRLRAHAQQVRRHVDQLAAKRYWEQFASAPEFVVMFMPSEAFYQAAVEKDRDLQEYAYAKRVFIATPTTLVAMLRTVAHAWKEDALARNAHEVLAVGRELHQRLSTMGDHLSKLGRSLEAATKGYNQTVASLESRVLVSARRFGQLQHVDDQIQPIPRLSTDVTELSAAELTPESADSDVPVGD